MLARWLESLIQLPNVEAVWLEGSMARGQANPASDIDVRIALADAAYTELWEINPSAVLHGLGAYLLLETRFVRALTIEGIIVELWAHRTSELPSLKPYEWMSLLWRVSDAIPRSGAPRRAPPQKRGRMCARSP